MQRGVLCVLIADEAEKMTGDAAAGCRELDLVGTHPNMLAGVNIAYYIRDPRN